ncbi:MAG: site-2 protease family protein [Eubacteriales bacterium]|nr:site-2 protease family protein [Eubacteriales bacterium]
MPVVLSRILNLAVLLFSLSWHECAHAYTSYRLGDETAAEQGRLTLNPLAHVDPLGALMMLFAPIAWAKPVPVNPSRFRPGVNIRNGMLKVAAAGPVSNLIIASAAHLVFTLMSLILFFRHHMTILQVQSGSVLFYAGIVLRTLYFLNLNLAVFNLLPFPPLDGFNIYGRFLPAPIYQNLYRYSNYFFYALIFLAIFASPVLGRILSVVRSPLEWLIQLPSDLILRLVGVQ